MFVVPQKQIGMTRSLMLLSSPTHPQKSIFEMEPCLRFPGQVLPNGSGILAEKWGAQGGTPSPVINGVIAPMSKVK